MEVQSLEELQDVYDAVYISPHLDDAVFSCAAHIQSQRDSGKRVLVVSVFTAAGDASAPVKASLVPFLNVERRREEDSEAMRSLGVDFHHMGLPEMLFRHRAAESWLWGPAEVARIWLLGLFRTEGEVEEELVQQLRQLLARTQCQWLIGPAGVGAHPDHLLVHRACVTAGKEVQTLWHYYEFPYCTYRVLTWLRRWALDVQHSLQDVEVELSERLIARRRELMAMYATQVKACFGTEEQLEAATESYREEHFLEVHRDGHMDRGVLPLPSVARRSKDTAMGILNRMLVVDLVISLLALYWVRHGLDWSDSDLHALRFAYAVVVLSILRVMCLAGKSSITLSWWLCVSSIFLTAAAFSYTGEVRSVLLASYFSLQMWLGGAEQSVANFVRKAKKDNAEEEDVPLRVLVVSDYMPPQKHGIATHTNGLVCALRASGCVVDVYTTTMGAADGSTFLNWAITNPWNPGVRLSMLPSFALLKTILGGQWSVVHVVFPNFIPWPVMLAAWLAGVPIYASQHCDLDRLGKVYVGRLLYHLMQAAYYLVSYLPIYLFATLHAAPTRGFIETHPFMRKFERERVAVVPSSIDESLFHPEGRPEDRAALQSRLALHQDQVLWLVVARLAPEKDIQELLEALQFFLERWPDEPQPALIVAGDGPLRSELENFAKDRALPVHFLGFLSLPEVASLYRACDVCVTNSVQETFGLTVLESLSSGCPMVMPHCDVFDELYAASLSSWMYTKQDIPDLAGRMLEASRPAARERLAELRRGGRLSASLFWSWRAAAAEQAEQYRLAGERLRETRARAGTWLRTVLMVIIILTLLIVCIVSVACAGAEVKQLYHRERTAMLRHSRSSWGPEGSG